MSQYIKVRKLFKGGNYMRKYGNCLKKYVPDADTIAVPTRSTSAIIGIHYKSLLKVFCLNGPAWTNTSRLIASMMVVFVFLYVKKFPFILEIGSF